MKDQARASIRRGLLLGRDFVEQTKSREEKDAGSDGLRIERFAKAHVEVAGERGVARSLDFDGGDPLVRSEGLG